MWSRSGIKRQSPWTRLVSGGSNTPLLTFKWLKTRNHQSDLFYLYFYFLSVRKTLTPDQAQPRLLGLHAVFQHLWFVNVVFKLQSVTFQLKIQLMFWNFFLIWISQMNKTIYIDFAPRSFFFFLMRVNLYHLFVAHHQVAPPPRLSPPQWGGETGSHVNDEGQMLITTVNTRTSNSGFTP